MDTFVDEPNRFFKRQLVIRTLWLIMATYVPHKLHRQTITTQQWKSAGILSYYFIVPQANPEIAVGRSRTSLPDGIHSEKIFYK